MLRWDSPARSARCWAPEGKLTSQAFPRLPCWLQPTSPRAMSLNSAHSASGIGVAGPTRQPIFDESAESLFGPFNVRFTFGRPHTVGHKESFRTCCRAIVLRRRCPH